MARHRQPAEREEEEQFIGSCGTWQRRERAAGGLRHQCPALPISASLSLPTFGCWGLSPLRMGFFRGAGSLAACSCGSQKPAERELTLLLPAQQRGNEHSDWPRWDHVLTPLVTHTTVHPHSPQLPYGYARKLGFLVSHSAPAKCQVLCKRISFNQHIALQKDRLGRALVVPTDRSPTQISLSQKREFIAHIIDKSRSGLQACVSLAPALSPNLPHPGIGWALPTQQEGCPRQPRPRWPFQPSVPGEERCLLFVCRANAWGGWSL